MSALLGMNLSAVRGSVLVGEQGDEVVLIYSDEEDPLILRLFRTGDCGGLAKDDDKAVRVPHFFGDRGAPRSVIMMVGWFVAWLVGWSVGWLLGCLLGWLVGWLLGCLVGCSLYSHCRRAQTGSHVCSG